MNVENQYSQYPQPDTNEEQFINIDFKKLFADILKLWWLFLISIIIALVGVRVYLRYKVPVYRSTISIILDDMSNSSSSLTTQNSMIEGFMVDPGMRNIDNQIAVLQSYSLVSKVVECMGIYVSFAHKGRLKTVEQYGFKAFSVVMDSTHVQPIDVPIFITDIDGSTFRLEVNAEKASLYNYKLREYDGSISNLNINIKCRYGDPIITPWCAFSIIKNDKFDEGNYFCFEDPDNVISRFRNTLSVSRDEKSSSSVVELSVSGTNINRNNDFLDALAYTFINDNLNQKNLIAENTIKFIEGQLTSISDTLDEIGTKLSQFKVAHGLQQTLNSKGEAKFREIRVYEEEIQEQQLLGAYYDYLATYFANDSVLNGVIAPAVFKTNASSAIAEQLTQIMTLNAERQAYQDTYGKNSNPAARTVSAKLQIARNTLLQSIASHREQVDENINELRSKIHGVESELSTMPETERKLLGVERSYSLNNDVYTFLLRKRSESQIQKASNTSDHRILDAASNNGQISPNPGKTQSMALVIAIILPLGFIVVRQLLDDKIRVVEDIRKITDKPIVGEISNCNKDTQLVVLNYPRSILSEMFRRMRSRIDFMVAQKEVPIIAVTSSIPGEGKTFCAINIASVFAISGKRTVLLGFDLRKPGMSKVLGTENMDGLSNYIVGATSLDDIVYKVDENFDTLPSGVIPPNPAELIESPKCIELLNELKERYDVIIIDTPPIGLVSDAYTIARWCDTLLFVVRQDFTLKDALKYSITSLEDEKLKNVGLVVNDIDNAKARYGYGYGKYGRYGKKYSYGYGYGVYGKKMSHGYYVED